MNCVGKIKPPTARPCGSCPYRRDVASGLWDASEYEKLPKYDDMGDPEAWNVFQCHQQNGHACAGWVACHDMENSIGVRLAFSMDKLEDPQAFVEYQTDVEVFDSGAEAAEHGMREIDNPSPEGRRAIDRLRAKAFKRGEISQ